MVARNSHPFSETPAFGDAIRRLRMASNLTQVEVAERLGVCQQTFGSWERGRPPHPRFEAVIKSVFEAMGYTPFEEYVPAIVRMAEITQPSSSAEAPQPMSQMRERILGAFITRLANGPALSEPEVALFRELTQTEAGLSSSGEAPVLPSGVPE